MGYVERNALIRIGTTIRPIGMDVTFHEALRRLVASQAYQDAEARPTGKGVESDRAVLINDVYDIYKKAAIEEFLNSPLGAEAKKARDQLNQARIDQRGRLGGVMANERPMLQPEQGESSVMRFVQEVTR